MGLINSQLFCEEASRTPLKSSFGSYLNPRNHRETLAVFQSVDVSRAFWLGASLIIRDTNMADVFAGIDRRVALEELRYQIGKALEASDALTLHTVGCHLQLAFDLISEEEIRRAESHLD